MLPSELVGEAEGQTQAPTPVLGVLFRCSERPCVLRPVGCCLSWEVPCDVITPSFARERFQFRLGRHGISFTDFLQTFTPAPNGQSGLPSPSQGVLLSASAAGVPVELQTPCGGGGGF